MTPNNETVSRQNLWAGTITREGWPLAHGKGFLRGLLVIPNHFKTGHEVNSSFCLPSGPIITCWIYHRYAVNKWLLQCYAIFSAASIIWFLIQERGNLDRKQATVPVKIHSNAYVRLGNFNPPTFCLVYSIVARAWIHKCPSGRARHVYNSIWAN